jgi:hypothetical protein
VSVGGLHLYWNIHTIPSHTPRMTECESNVAGQTAQARGYRDFHRNGQT